MAVQTNILPTNAAGAPATAFAGPVVSGNHFGQNTSGIGPNQGLSIMMQQVTLNQNGASAVSATVYLPKHSIIIDIIADTVTAWDSATGDSLTVGTTAGGAQYAPATAVKAQGRVRPTFTTTLGTLLDTGSNEAVVATITPTGAATVGQTVVTYIYAQTVNWQNP
jgi:hypothetical protein